MSARPETPKKKKSIAEHGEWQVVHSEKFNVPFFFNSTNNTGQFKVPAELESIYGKLSHGDADGLGISPPTPGNVVYSPTQKKSQISTPRDKDGVVRLILVYINMSVRRKSQKNLRLGISKANFLALLWTHLCVSRRARHTKIFLTRPLHRSRSQLYRRDLC